MNVIIGNKHDEMFADLRIDVIKRENGEFTAEEIIEKYSNFFFQRLVLDITAIKNHEDISNLQKISIAFDMDKIILLLDGKEQAENQEYISKLISMEIYNFTVNTEGIMYLYEHPNTYKDVAHLQFLDNVNNVQREGKVNEILEKKEQKIIGFKGLTEVVGTTTLVYLLKKQLEKKYDVMAIQEGSMDFDYFKDKDLVSVPEGKLATELLQQKDVEIILVDLSKDSKGEECTEIIYLLEPSRLKLNKLIKRNRKVFEELKGKKIVINRSMLTSKDVLDLEYEGKFKTFFNIPPLNEREFDHKVLSIFLSKLGFVRGEDEEKSVKNGLFGLFSK